MLCPNHNHAWLFKPFSSSSTSSLSSFNQLHHLQWPHLPPPFQQQTKNPQHNNQTKGLSSKSFDLKQISLTSHSMTPPHFLSHHHHHLKHQVHHSKHHPPMEHITPLLKHPLAQRQPHHLSHHLSKTCHPCSPNIVQVLTPHSWVINHHLPLILSNLQETNILLQQTHSIIPPHHQMGLWRTILSLHHHLQILVIPFPTILQTTTLWGVLVVITIFISYLLFEMNYTSCLVTLSISLL